MFTIVAVTIAIVIGFVIGRASIKMTYGGEIITEVGEDGRFLFTLQVDTDVDELPNKKRVVFKVLPKENVLF